MNQIALKTLVVLLMCIASSCSKQEVKQEVVTDNTTFEEYIALFPNQIPDFKGINIENGKDLGENPEIDPLYVKQFIAGKPFQDIEDKSDKFIENQDITYRLVMKVSLNSNFHSLIISANEEGNPSNEWAYYLLNYTKEGQYIEGILLSYRNSFSNEETTVNVQQSEYRYVSFLPEKQLHFVDVSYDNTNTALIDNDSHFMLTASGETSNQYFRESWYQISEKGTFLKLKTTERDKKDAQP
jgi:hypothetical protein